MRYVSIAFLFLFLYSCQKTEVPNDTAAQLSGRYDIKTYVVTGDTLFGNGIDSFGYKAFYIQIGRKSADSLTVTLQTQKEGTDALTSIFRYAGFDLAGDSYILSYTNLDSQEYRSEISGEIFSQESTLSSAFLVVPENYTPKAPADPNLNGVVIRAEKLAK